MSRTRSHPILPRELNAEPKPALLSTSWLTREATRRQTPIVPFRPTPSPKSRERAAPTFEGGVTLRGSTRRSGLRSSTPRRTTPAPHTYRVSHSPGLRPGPPPKVRARLPRPVPSSPQGQHRVAHRGRILQARRWRVAAGLVRVGVPRLPINTRDVELNRAKREPLQVRSLKLPLGGVGDQQIAERRDEHRRYERPRPIMPQQTAIVTRPVARHAIEEEVATVTP